MKTIENRIIKKTTCLFLLILGIISCTNDDDLASPSAWKTQNDVSNKDLTDIEFYNNDFGVISGSYGTLLKTDNGGESWSELNVGPNDSFVKTFILNENEFFTSRLGLYKTNNNGNTFKEIGNFSDYDWGSIFAIHFFDSDNGLICKNGVIYKTIDGGQVWDVSYDNAGYAKILQFVSPHVGYISGGVVKDGYSEGEIHKSLDGGKSWSQINIQTSKITSMYFLTEQLGYFSNLENQFLKTQNGGETWEIIGNSPMVFHDILFLDNNVGYGVGSSSIYKTENGGKNWTEDYENSSMSFNSITKTLSGKLFVVGNDGIILRKQ